MAAGFASQPASAEWLCRLLHLIVGGESEPAKVKPAPIAETKKPDAKPREVASLRTPKEGSLIPRLGTRYLNGSLLDVKDDRGNPRRILVLSDYMQGHTSHLTSEALPPKWTLVAIVQRGEYEFVDGQAVRVNTTSGDAAREGARNDVRDAEKYLIDSALVRPTSRFLPFDKAKPHLYDGFNEPGGPPKGLHSLRHRAFMAFNHCLDFLALGDPGYLMKHKHIPELVLTHWDVLVSNTEGNRYTSLKVGLMSLVEGYEVTRAQSQQMVADLKELKAKMGRIEVLEVATP